MRHKFLPYLNFLYQTLSENPCRIIINQSMPDDHLSNNWRENCNSINAVYYCDFSGAMNNLYCLFIYKQHENKILQLNSVILGIVNRIIDEASFGNCQQSVAR